MGWQMPFMATTWASQVGVWFSFLFFFLINLRLILRLDLYICVCLSAENVAKQWNISREEQDKFAVQSQNKTEAAQKAGHFDQEIVPIMVPSRKGERCFISSVDVFSTCMDSTLSFLPQVQWRLVWTSFHVTAATWRACLNSDPVSWRTAVAPSLQETPQVFRVSVMNDEQCKCLVCAWNWNEKLRVGVNDGAAATVLMSQSEAQRRGIKPMAKIVSWAQAGLEPSIMGTGPIAAIRKAVRSGWWSSRTFSFRSETFLLAELVSWCCSDRLRKQAGNWTRWTYLKSMKHLQPSPLLLLKSLGWMQTRWVTIKGCRKFFKSEMLMLLSGPLLRWMWTVVPFLLAIPLACLAAGCWWHCCTPSRGRGE